MGELNTQLWVISPDPEVFPLKNTKVVLWATGREQAKRQAAKGWLTGMGDPDKFICTPITNPGDRVKLEIALHR